MIQKTLLLFQLLLAVCAFYVLLHYSGSLRLLASLGLLVGMFVVAKAEGSFREDGNGRPNKDRTITTEQLLDCLLKSKNVLPVTEAIHYLLEDLGLTVSAVLGHSPVDRLIRIPDLQVTIGLKVIGDVGELNGSWDRWEELSAFDQGRGGKQRLLIIGSNWSEGGGDPRQKYKNFSLNARELLAARELVATTTLTLCKIYLLCKKKGLDIKTIFHRIQHHPGGVFHLEHYAP